MSTRCEDTSSFFPLVPSCLLKLISPNKRVPGYIPLQLCNYYVAAGFNSSGIANAGGAGLALAEWITAGEPTMDLFSVDIRRFAPHHNNKRYLRESVKETLAWHYLLRFPYSEKTRARRVRCSSLYSDLNAAGALWGDKMGWEVAKWFGLPGQGAKSVQESHD